jgi:uncharacterized protein YjiS (DUF1127 family)
MPDWPVQEVAMIMLSSALALAPSALRLVRQAVAVVVALAVSLGHALRHRREISALAELDDHALIDLGLTRTDGHSAWAVSVLEDPSHVIKDIAGAGHGQAVQATSPGAADHGDRQLPARGVSLSASPDRHKAGGRSSGLLREPASADYFFRKASKMV